MTDQTASAYTPPLYTITVSADEVEYIRASLAFTASASQFVTESSILDRIRIERLPVVVEPHRYSALSEIPYGINFTLTTNRKLIFRKDSSRGYLVRTPNDDSWTWLANPDQEFPHGATFVEYLDGIRMPSASNFNAASASATKDS